MKLSKECAEIQSNFAQNQQQHENDIVNTNEEILLNNQENANSNLMPLGRIHFSGLHKQNEIKNTKVRLNRNNVLKLQNYLNVLC